MFPFQRFAQSSLSVIARNNVIPKFGTNAASKNSSGSLAYINTLCGYNDRPVKIFNINHSKSSSAVAGLVGTTSRKYSDSSGGLERRKKADDIPLSILNKPKPSDEDEQRWFHPSSTERLENPAYTYLKNHPEYQTLFFQHQVYSRLMTEDGRLTAEGEETVNPAVKAFIDLCNSEPDEIITDPKYDPVFVELISQTSKLTDVELLLVYYNLRRFPKRPKAKDKDYRKIWQPLDDLCLRRFNEKAWSLEYMFNMADLIFSADLQTESKFHWELVKKLYRRVDSLSKEEFIRMMFCFGGVKSLPDSLSIYNIEYNLPKFIDELTSEEVAVVSVGFLRTRTYVNNKEVVKKMLDIVANDATRVPSTNISAVAKAVTLSANYYVSEDVYNFLDAFVSEIPRIDTHACASLVLLAMRTKVEHEKLMLEMVKKLEGNINVMRSKDLEYMTAGLTTFNVNCEELYEEIVEEFQARIRNTPLKAFCFTSGRSFIYILHHLSQRNIYPQDLISFALSNEFLDCTFGRSMYLYPQEVLLLDICTGLEADGYKGPRLSEKYQGFLTKKNMLWIAAEEKAKTSDYQSIARYMLELCDNFLGGPEFCHLCNVVPPFRTIGAVYCIDEVTQKPVPVPESFTSIDDFNIKYIPESTSDNKNVKYHAFVLFPGTHAAVNTANPIGVAVMHCRQMQKMGYQVHPLYLGHTVNGPEEMKQAISEILEQQTVKRDSSSVS